MRAWPGCSSKASRPRHGLFSSEEGRPPYQSLLRQAQFRLPATAPLAVDFDSRRREIRIGKDTGRNRDHAGPALDLVEEADPAGRAEIVPDPKPLVRSAGEASVSPGDADLTGGE